MSARTWIAAVALLAAALAAPVASAHESYEIGDGAYTLTVGDQNEPIYTYKWTNLDLIIRDSDGNPVEDAHEDLEGVLVGPGGEELEGTLEGQFGEEGRYEFAEGHFYTQPGQYTLELEGTIDGVDVTGSYDLPGPRQSMTTFGFPHDDVPTVLDLQDRVATLAEDQAGEEDQEQRIAELESEVASLQDEIQTLREDQQRLEEEQNSIPSLGAAAALTAMAAVALVGVRRR